MKRPKPATFDVTVDGKSVSVACLPVVTNADDPDVSFAYGGMFGGQCMVASGGSFQDILVATTRGEEKAEWQLSSHTPQQIRSIVKPFLAPATALRMPLHFTLYADDETLTIVTHIITEADWGAHCKIPRQGDITITFECRGWERQFMVRRTTSFARIKTRCKRLAREARRLQKSGWGQAE